LTIVNSRRGIFENVDSAATEPDQPMKHATIGLGGALLNAATALAPPLTWCPSIAGIETSVRSDETDMN
jgi:hypothetical protein